MMPTKQKKGFKFHGAGAGTANAGSGTACSGCINFRFDVGYK